MSPATNDVYDPWQAADNPEVRNKTYFGHCTVDSHPVVLRRGMRAMNFDPYQHRVEDRRTQVQVSIQPLAGSKYMDPINRDVLVESNEYAKTFWPSVRALGLKVSDLGGKYVRCEMIPTRQYVKADGTPGTVTVPKVIAVYATEAECRAAQDALFGRQEAASEPATSTAPATTAPGQASAGMTPESQTALLNALWNASRQNTAQFETLLKVTPQLNHLTLDSEPVKRAMGVF